MRISDYLYNESLADPGRGVWRGQVYFNTRWMNEHAPDRTFLFVLDFSAVPGWIAGARPALTPTGDLVTRGDQVGPLAVAVQSFSGEDDFDAPYRNIALARDLPFQTNWSQPEYPAFMVTQDWPWPSPGSAVKIIPYTYSNPPVRGAHHYADFSFYSNAQGLIPLVRAHVLFPVARGTPPPWPYEDPWIVASPGASGVVRSGKGR